MHYTYKAQQKYLFHLKKENFLYSKSKIALLHLFIATCDTVQYATMSCAQWYLL